MLALLPADAPGPHRIGFGCMGITAFYGDPYVIVYM